MVGGPVVLNLVLTRGVDIVVADMMQEIRLCSRVDIG